MRACFALGSILLTFAWTWSASGDSHLDPAPVPREAPVIADADTTARAHGVATASDRSPLARYVLLRLARADAFLLADDRTKAMAELEAIERLLEGGAARHGAGANDRGALARPRIHLPIEPDPELDQALTRLRPYRPRDATAVRVDLRAISRRVRDLVDDPNRLGPSSAFLIGAASLGYVDAPPTSLAEDHAPPAELHDESARQPG